MIKQCVICGATFEGYSTVNKKTCSPGCSKERKRQYHQQYYADPERKERILQYRATPEHKERMRQYGIQRRATPERKERMRQQIEQWYADPENKERKLQRDKQRRATPEYRERERERRATPEYREWARINVANRNARKRNLPNTLTPTQWQSALDYFHGCCAVCGRQMNDMFGEFTAAMDHWIPLAYEGDDNPGTVAGNIVCLCHGVGGCNNSKNSTMPDVWLRRKYSEHKARQIEQRIETYVASEKLGDAQQVDEATAIEIIRTVAQLIHQQYTHTQQILGRDLVTGAPLLKA